LEYPTAWLGELSVDQESCIRQWIAELPDGADAWLAHRNRREDMWLDLLGAFTDLLRLKPALEFSRQVREHTFLENCRKSFMKFWHQSGSFMTLIQSLFGGHRGIFP